MRNRAREKFQAAFRLTTSRFVEKAISEYRLRATPDEGHEIRLTRNMHTVRRLRLRKIYDWESSQAISTSGYVPLRSYATFPRESCYQFSLSISDWFIRLVASPRKRPYILKIFNKNPCLCRTRDENARHPVDSAICRFVFRDNWDRLIKSWKWTTPGDGRSGPKLSAAVKCD